MNTIKVVKKDNYAIVQLSRGKVNAVNLRMVEELTSVFQSFEKDDTVNGVIITGQPQFFTAGLDVIELYDYNEETIKSMFIQFGELYAQMAKFPKPLIAAITGHAPAAGTVLSIPCDYRVMADGEKYTIGLHEIKVNIGLSEDVINGYAFWLGEGLATRYLLKGKLMNAQEAHAVGFVDEVCPLENVLEKAEQQMLQYLKAEPQIFQSIKLKTRKYWLESFNKNREEELNESLEIWWKPEVRAKMKGFVERLTKRSQV